MVGRQGKTALKIVSAAAVVATAWMTGGFMFHSMVMENANEKEREFATSIKWDNKKVPLHAFNPDHPNNKNWKKQRQHQEEEEEEVNQR
jgi:hypothetical protein